MFRAFGFDQSAILGLVRKAAVPGLRLAARAVVAELKEIVGTEGFGEPSPPGHAPFLQTGELRESISYEIDEATLTATIVVAHPAAFYLEYGTRFMAPRPFLRRGLLGYRVFAHNFVGMLGARHLGEDLTEAT